MYVTLAGGNQCLWNWLGWSIAWRSWLWWGCRCTRGTWIMDPNQLQVLINSVDPLQRSEVYGIDLYEETKRIVHNLLNATSVSTLSWMFTLLVLGKLCLWENITTLLSNNKAIRKLNIVTVSCSWYSTKCRMDGKFTIEAYPTLAKNSTREEYIYT